MPILERAPNTTQWGGPFDSSVVDKVWAKAQTSTPLSVILGTVKDICGATIHRADYGKTTRFGWEIDHIAPVASGGTDDLPNLQPLHWKNNRSKGDQLIPSPSIWCKVRS